MLRFGSAASIFAAVFLTVLTPLIALAQTPTAAPRPVSILDSAVPMIAILGIMYFLMIRPQMKKQKTHQEFLTKLKRGDEVLTTGGILGRIEGLTDVFITLEIAPGVRIRVVRSQVASFVPTATAGAEVKA